jgi:hypothetical protein
MHRLGLTKSYAYMQSMHLSEAKMHYIILDRTSQVVCTSADYVPIGYALKWSVLYAIN